IRPWASRAVSASRARKAWFARVPPRSSASSWAPSDGARNGTPRAQRAIARAQLFAQRAVMNFNGLIDLGFWGYVGVTLLLTHVTIACVTIFLHRHQAHRALSLHPVVSHFFRAWLWFTTGMVTREWVAVHRKHHAVCETDNDPHSPQTHGIARVLFAGVGL